MIRLCCHIFARMEDYHFQHGTSSCVWPVALMIGQVWTVFIALPPKVFSWALRLHFSKPHKTCRAPWECLPGSIWFNLSFRYFSKKNNPQLLQYQFHYQTFWPFRRVTCFPNFIVGNLTLNFPKKGPLRTSSSDSLARCGKRDKSCPTPTNARIWSKSLPVTESQRKKTCVDICWYDVFMQICKICMVLEICDICFIR